MKGRTTVTLLEPKTTTVDDYTELPIADWKEPPTEHPDVPAGIEPVSSSEHVLTAGTVISRWTCFLPPEHPVTPAWRVRWRGEDYEIDGDVSPWEGRGRVRYLECVLKKVS